MYIWVESQLKREINGLRNQVNQLKDEKIKLSSMLNSQPKNYDSFIKLSLISANIQAFEKLTYNQEQNKNQFSIKAIVSCDNVRDSDAYLFQTQSS